MTEPTYTLTFFRDKYDNKVEFSETYTWAELTEFFSEHVVTSDKNKLGFVAATFKSVDEQPLQAGASKGAPIEGTVGRYAENVKSIHCVVLDYDGGVTIDEVKSRLAGLRHLGYTSFNHLKDGVTHKFRVVLPLSRACTPSEWVERRPGMLDLFEGVDSSTFSVARIFFTPAKPDGVTSLAWNTDGEPFDLFGVAPFVYVAPEHPPSQLVDGQFKDAVLQQVAKCNFQSYDDWKALAGRLYNAGFSLSDYQQLSHADAKTQKDCVGLWKWCERQGTPSGLGPLIHRVREEFPNWSPPAAPLIFKPAEKRSEEPREEVKLPTRQFNALTSPSARRQLVRDFVRKTLRSYAKHAILRTPEGYGKSTEIVAELLRSGHDVLFCCLSNLQADEKMRDFELYQPVRVWSKGGLVEKELGFKPPQLPVAENSFDYRGIDEAKTIEMIVKHLECSEDDAKQVVVELSERAGESRDSRARLLITTFATGNLMFKNARGQPGRVVVVDDPSMGELLTSKFSFVTEEVGYDDVTSTSLQEVATRDVEEVYFGQEFEFQEPVIWTTTEAIVTRALQKQHPGCHITDVVEAIETDKRVMLIGTDLVRKATKKVLPGMQQAVEEATHVDLLFIANGVQGQFNLVNTKGRNDLAKNTVIAISYPHPCDVLSVVATLGLQPEQQDTVMRQMVTDVMDQAIGRSQGYRGAGGHRALVLADTQLVDSLKNRSRYDIRDENGLKRRGRLKNSPLTWHVEYPNWWAEWTAYIRTWDKYIKVMTGRDGKKHVFELFTLAKVGLAQDEQKLIERRLKKPADFTQHVWRAHQEVIDSTEEGGRRRFSEKLRELVNEQNVNRSTTKAVKAKTAEKRTGKRKYHKPGDPNQRPRMIDPNSVPPGWEPVPPSRRTGGARGRPAGR